MASGILGVTLPAYAVTANAFPWTVALENGSLAGGIGYTPNGHYIDIPDSFFCSLTTDATVGNRVVEIEVLNADGFAVYLIPAPNTQGPSLVGNYQFTTTTTVAYGPIGRASVAPMPLIPLLEGWSFTARVDGTVGAGDMMDGRMLSMTRVPTGQTGPDLSLVPVPVTL